MHPSRCALLLCLLVGVVSLRDGVTAQSDREDGVQLPITDKPWQSDTGSMEESLLMSLSMIVISEIGDKTFLIAAIMAMKHARWVVFLAAFTSLIVMSILSAFLGHAVPQLINKQHTDALAAVLFLFFGLRMLWEAHHMSDSEGTDEMVEVEAELQEAERHRVHMLETLEVGGFQPEKDVYRNHKIQQIRKKLNRMLRRFCSLATLQTFLQTFVLTFMGEWGDRSQISTIALAAANNVYWVTAGVIVGHGLCTALAVTGGRMLAAKISVKTVTLAGAILFFTFGIYYAFNAYSGQIGRMA